MTIRIVLADDQALVRGALAALLDLEPDIEVVGQAEDGREVDGEGQELDQLEPLLEKAIQRFAAVVLEHKGGGSFFANKCQRPRRPAGIKLVRERVFVLEPLDECRPTGDERQHWHGIAGLPGAKQRKLSIVPQRL